MVKYEIYFEGRMKWICWWLDFGVREREKNESLDSWPEQFGEWYHYLTQMGKTEGVFRGYDTVGLTCVLDMGLRCVMTANGVVQEVIQVCVSQERWGTEINLGAFHV